MNITSSRVYVCPEGQYAQGKYLDLICFATAESFICECRRLFTNRTEYIYFDYENIPEVYISQKWISPNYFPLIRAAARLDADQQEAFTAWLDYHRPDLEEKDVTGIIHFFRYCYVGSYRSSTRFAYEYARSYLNITRKNSPSFDFEGFENTLFNNLFQYIGGKYVFKKIQMG